jgi:ribosomal protein L24
MKYRVNDRVIVSQEGQYKGKKGKVIATSEQSCAVRLENGKELGFIDCELELDEAEMTKVYGAELGRIFGLRGKD